QKKTTTMSLTISSCSRESSSGTGLQQRHSSLVQPLRISSPRMQSPSYSQHSSGNGGVAPSFVKEKQDVSTVKGQLVVLECRVRGTPPLQVLWYREEEQIVDSADFRILKKKASSVSVPEEVCTLVITEAFPEDSGMFKCVAGNQYGTVSCSALLDVYSGLEEVLAHEETTSSPAEPLPDTLPSFPHGAVEIPPPEWPDSPEEDSEPCADPCSEGLRSGAPLIQLSTSTIRNESNSTARLPRVSAEVSSGKPNSALRAHDKHMCTVPYKLPSHRLSARRRIKFSDVTEMHRDLGNISVPPGWLRLQLQALKRDMNISFHSWCFFFPPPSAHSLFRAHEIKSPTYRLPVFSHRFSPTSYPPSAFNYERPRHFIQAQPRFQAPSYESLQPRPPQASAAFPNGHRASPSSSTLSSPVSTPSSSLGSPREPPAPRPASPSPSVPPPRPPSPAYSPRSPTPPRLSPPGPQSASGQPASLPANHRPAPAVETSPVTSGLSPPPPIPPYSFPRQILKKKSPRPASHTTDEEIQGSKDALIQDLEKKLRCKEARRRNGSQKLTYEERMARRLLGPDSAASVFDIEGSQDSQTEVHFSHSCFYSKIHQTENTPAKDNSGKCLPVYYLPHNSKRNNCKLRHIFAGQLFFCIKPSGARNTIPIAQQFGSGYGLCSDLHFMSRGPQSARFANGGSDTLQDCNPLLLLERRSPKGFRGNSGSSKVKNLGYQARTPCSSPGLGHRNMPESGSEDPETASIQEKCYAPRFLQVPQDLTVEEGRFCRIDFKVGGLPTPDVSWYLNGKLIGPDDYHKMLVCEKGVHSFIIEIVTVHHAGEYECVARNRAGESRFTLHLSVIAQELQRPPVFVRKMQNSRALEGDSVRLECQVSASPPPQLYWKKDKEMMRVDPGRMSLYQDNSGRLCLLIDRVEKADAGWYTVSAINEAGMSTCNARLDVGTRLTKAATVAKPLKVRPTFSQGPALAGQGAGGPRQQAPLCESEEL
uniref:Ig-like domain-containing protein n=1 Tax=Lepisosteus oculatus TaxID=7918 RepID=W5N2G2_LEPOC